MAPKQEFADLVEQLTYLDHEYDTDIAGELTEVITHGKTEGLAALEIIDLVEDRISKLKRTDQLVETDQVELVQTFLEHLPNVL